MYRDDLAATHARVEQLQRELMAASSQGAEDKQRIAALTAQLAQMQETLHRMQISPPPPGYMMTRASRATTVLTLGILSLVLCSALGPIAWSMGNEEIRRIDAGMTMPDGRGYASAGRICGMIATGLLVLTGFMVLVGFALAAGSH
jgi:hypothetical protein